MLRLANKQTSLLASRGSAALCSSHYRFGIFQVNFFITDVTAKNLRPWRNLMEIHSFIHSFIQDLLCA